MLHPERDPVGSTLWHCPSIPMFVVDVHEDGDFSYADFNPAAEKITGFTRAQLAGRNIQAATELVPAWMVDAMRANYQRCVALARSIQYEERIDAGGRERHWRTQLVPYIGPGGRVEKIVGLAIEITDRVREETARAESDARFAALLEAACEGVWLVDENWQTKYTNPALTRMLGYPAEELLRLRLEQLILPEDAPFLANKKTERETGRAESNETRLRAKDGQVVWVSYSAAPIFGPDNTFRGAVAMLSDVTARKLAEAQAREEEEKLREFQRLEALGLMAGSIAHDFNNLLSGILGNLTFLRDEFPKQSNSQEALHAIEMASSRAAALCRQLLAYSGRGRFEVVTLDLSKFVTEMMDLLRTSVDRRHGVELSLTPEAFVRVDASQLQQIIMNLVINASEAMKNRPGVIRISTTKVPTSSISLTGAQGVSSIAASHVVILRVIDDGPGMSESVLSRIFEPFFSTKGQGRGLGLAAVLGIVRGHGGVMRVSSTPDVGTTFEFVLPASETAAEQTAPVRAPPTLSGQGETVLIIDDEPILRRTARRILERHGYTVIESEDGEQGIEMLYRQQKKLAAVLLDLTMPRMDGASVLRKLKDICPDLPVVLTSGFSEHEVEGLLTGRHRAFVPKPFTGELLLTALARVRECAPKE